MKEPTNLWEQEQQYKMQKQKKLELQERFKGRKIPKRIVKGVLIKSSAPGELLVQSGYKETANGYVRILDSEYRYHAFVLSSGVIEIHTDRTQKDKKGKTYHKAVTDKLTEERKRIKSFLNVPLPKKSYGLPKSILPLSEQRKLIAGLKPVIPLTTTAIGPYTVAMVYNKDKAREKALLEYPFLRDFDNKQPQKKPLDFSLSRWEKQVFRIAAQRANRTKLIENILLLRKHDLTLQAIGDYYGLTRERIRQLAGDTPEYKQYLRQRYVENRKDISCLWCKKKITVLSKSKAKYCSKACSGKARTLPGGEQRLKERNRRNARRYYWEVLKKHPDIKEIIRKRNHRYINNFKNPDIKRRSSLFKAIEEIKKEPNTQS